MINCANCGCELEPKDTRYYRIRPENERLPFCGGTSECWMEFRRAYAYDALGREPSFAYSDKLTDGFELLSMNEDAEDDHGLPDGFQIYRVEDVPEDTY